jgi:mannose-6-phosphate isomerase-like protein (cupin superfamily)
MKIEKKNLEEKFKQINDYWSPKIAGEINDSHIKLVKIIGEFDWHHHVNEDELFLVVKGKLLMKLRDNDIEINEGEFIIIPKGEEHKPVAENEVHLILMEPKGTLNTGNIVSEKTVEKLEWI